MINSIRDAIADTFNTDTNEMLKENRANKVRVYGQGKVSDSQQKAVEAMNKKYIYLIERVAKLEMNNKLMMQQQSQLVKYSPLWNKLQRNINSNIIAIQVCKVGNADTIGIEGIEKLSQEKDMLKQDRYKADIPNQQMHGGYYF